jgi:hypothetical protein
MTERKKILLRLDPAVHDAVARWAADELRSTNAQIEFLLRRALGDAGRMPGGAGQPARRGRPPKRAAAAEPAGPAGPADPAGLPDEADEADHQADDHGGDDAARHRIRGTGDADGGTGDSGALGTDT